MIVKRAAILFTLSLILVLLSLFIQTPRSWSLDLASGANNGFPISYLSTHTYIWCANSPIIDCYRPDHPLYFLSLFNRSTYVDLEFETVPFTFYWGRFLIDVIFYYFLISIFLKIINKIKR
jgi:hypothetical protein